MFRPPLVNSERNDIAIFGECYWCKHAVIGERIVRLYHQPHPVDLGVWQRPARPMVDRRHWIPDEEFDREMRRKPKTAYEDVK